MTKQVIFDVGANNGSSCYYCADNPETIVYAFEPTPVLLRECLYPLQKENYKVIPYAISDFDGETSFNIAGQADWGCSSIHEFESDLDKTWPGRTDFKVTEKIKVLVRRMDTFIRNFGINCVDHIHCDTQGNDLKVLQSFGEYINIVRGGVVEAANQNPLYKGVDNSVDSISQFLEKNNFTITEITSNDIQNNEVNIAFKRK